MDERTQLLEKMGMSVAASAGSGDVNAPMPGKVLQVLVEPGQAWRRASLCWCSKR